MWSFFYLNYKLPTFRNTEENLGFALTILFGSVFLFHQVLEYFLCPFNIADGVLGSSFFALTGLHGLHVFIGICFLIICYIRTRFSHFTLSFHLGLLFSI